MKRSRALGGAVAIAAFFLIAVFFCGAFAANAAGPGQSAQGIVARVNGAPITRAQLDATVTNLLPWMFYHVDKVTKTQLEQAKKKALKGLINKELIYQEAKRRGITADGADVRKVIAADRKRYPSEKQFEEALARGGMNMAALKKDIEKELMVQALLNKEVLVPISDRQLEDYYSKNKWKFKEPATVGVQDIYIKIDPSDPHGTEKAMARAQKALAAVKRGMDFSKAASLYSDDPSGKIGGDMGYVHKGMLSPSLEKVAFKLKTGQTSGIIKASLGYHIIKIEGVRPCKQLSFAEIKDKLRAARTKSEQKKRYNALVNGLRAHAKIEYFQ